MCPTGSSQQPRSYGPPTSVAEARLCADRSTPVMITRSMTFRLPQRGTRGSGEPSVTAVPARTQGPNGPGSEPWRPISAGESQDDAGTEEQTDHRRCAPCFRPSIEFAFEAARLRGARLHVVHAWQEPSPLGLGPGEIGLVNGPEQADEWLGFLDAVIKVWRDKCPEVEVVETVAEGRARSVLVRAATGASLLVVGRRTSERPAGPRTGPVTHAAVQHVGCPVAVVPHE
ncbi:universal stress protein [Streptomyces sp. Tu102]|nr:universal stress protein [Streptomyces sp. Tu102]